MTISRHQAVGAYRLWEPERFDHHAEPAAAPEPEPELPAAALAGFALPTAEDIERMHEDARRAGFDEGHAQGHAEGLADGHREGHAAGYAEGRARAQEEAEHLAALVGDVDRALRTIDAEVADEIVALAIELARQVVGHSLSTHPETLIDTVRAALQQVPHAHARIRLHPADMELARTHLGDTLAHAGHRLEEDAALTRGSCRIDTPGSQVDATLETRWRRVLDTIRPSARATHEAHGLQPPGEEHDAAGAHA